MKRKYRKFNVVVTVTLDLPGDNKDAECVVHEALIHAKRTMPLGSTFKVKNWWSTFKSVQVAHAKLSGDYLSRAARIAKWRTEQTAH